MNKYTIYCTEEQTKKALELGAPIEIETSFMALVNRTYFDNENKYVIIPTADQMIGWLEDKYSIHIDVRFYCVSWDCGVRDKYDTIVANKLHYKTRKEATLTAIDKALDYLVNNN